MTRGLSLPWPILIASVGAALAVLGLLLSGSIVSAGAAATIDGGTWTFDASSKDNKVEVMATGLPSEGLGAADISVAFDSSVIEVTACDTGDLGGACNPNAPGGPAQAAGFAAPAVTTEPVVLGSFTFDCVGAAGTSSALTITVNEFVDGTAGDPQAIETSVTNGSVTCGVAATPAPQPVAPPPTGGLPPVDSSGGVGWLLVLGVALGVTGLGAVAFGARTLRRRI